MKTVVALIAMIAAVPLSAQYGPPAKDLEEASFYLREIVRQIEPPIQEARDQIQVLTILARVTNRLAATKPAEEIAFGMKIIDEYLERRERSERPLSRDNLKALLSVRRELELQQPPYANAALRERLHHEFVHPLERDVLRNKGKLDALVAQWEMFTARTLTPCEKELMTSIREVAKEQAVE